MSENGTGNPFNAFGKLVGTSESITELFILYFGALQIGLDRHPIRYLRIHRKSPLYKNYRDQKQFLGVLIANVYSCLPLTRFLWSLCVEN